MSNQISPLFQAVEDEARKRPTQERIETAAAICYEARRREAEIIQFRVNRELQRKHCEQEGKRNGHLMTGEIHPVELLAAEFLCPELKTSSWLAQMRAWRWVLKQDWGRDFDAAPIQRTRF